MLTNKRLLILCFVHYILILGFHLIYSVLFCSIDQTRKVSVWSVCVLILLFLFAEIFQRQIDLCVYVTIFSIILTVTYVGYCLESLAFGILIFFIAGVILCMFLRKIYVLVWFITSTITCIGYVFIWPDMIKKMISNIFLYYGYILVYIIGGINIYLLVSVAERSFNYLKKSNELKDQESTVKNIFWANISNEIRTPMNVINGMSSLLKSENLSVRSREYTEQIENASGMLLNIVNDTLELSNIESGLFKPEDSTYDIYNAAHNAILLASANVHSEKISLTYCINPRVPNVLSGDGDYVLKILLKLLNNAISFTDHGEIKLEIDIDPTEMTDNSVVIVIKVYDNGNVIDEGEVENFFAGFDSNMSGRTTEQESIGLSLRLCKSMVELLGGQIYVERREKDGNCFVVKVRQSIGSEFDLIKVMGKNLSEETGKWISVGASVLVIDDTPTNLKLISGMIKLHGIEPDIADSGKAALAMMEKKKYDLVFIDYMMPEMNGVDTLRQIQLRAGVPNFVNVSTVALTSRSLIKDRNKFLDLGFNEFITKPIDDRELENILRKFIVER